MKISEYIPLCLCNFHINQSINNLYLYTISISSDASLVGLSFHILGKCLNLGKASVAHTFQPTGIRIWSVSVN